MLIEEKTISSDKIYTGKIISLRVDTVEVERQGYQKREIVEHGGAVGIVAINENNEIVLIKQFRKAIEKVIWELPSGKLEVGENPKECAIRELKEETGYNAQHLKLIHKFFTSSEFSNQKIYIYLATGLKLEDNYIDNESVKICKIGLEDAYNMVIKNEIEDAKTSIGILLAKELI